MTESKLTHKQQVFISEYLKCFNASEAARRAGYSEARARITGSELLADSNISEQIQVRLSEIHMGADEALKLMADIARGDVTDFLTPFGAIDLDKMRESGKGRLIKKIKQRTITKIGKNEDEGDTETHDTEIEFYDAQTAIRDILKMLGRFTDRLDLSNSDGSLKPTDNAQVLDRVNQLLELAKQRKAKEEK